MIPVSPRAGWVKQRARHSAAAKCHVWHQAPLPDLMHGLNLTLLLSFHDHLFTWLLGGPRHALDLGKRHVACLLSRCSNDLRVPFAKFKCLLIRNCSSSQLFPLVVHAIKYRFLIGVFWVIYSFIMTIYCSGTLKKKKKASSLSGEQTTGTRERLLQRRARNMERWSREVAT